MVHRPATSAFRVQTYTHIYYRNARAVVIVICVTHTNAPLHGITTYMYKTKAAATSLSVKRKVDKTAIQKTQFMHCGFHFLPIFCGRTQMQQHEQSLRVGAIVKRVCVCVSERMQEFVDAVAYQSFDHYVGYSTAVYKSVAKNEVHKIDLYKYSIKVNVERATKYILGSVGSV